MCDTIRETMESDRIPLSSHLQSGNLREAIFRANPNYEFLLLDQLPEDQQQLLSALREDPDFAGLLQPRASAGVTAKAVCDRTAELFTALRTPGPLPAWMLEDTDSGLIIRQLVLDGILEMAEGAEWLSGPSASAPLQEETVFVEPGALAQLSRRAIEHAAAMSAGHPAALSAALYQFNTLPLTPAWIGRLPGEAAVKEYLQIHSGGRNDALLHRCWRRVDGHGQNSVWIGWSSRTCAPPEPGAVHYKLYFSPLPQPLKDVFRVWLRAISAGGAHHFKVGANARGLLRPDKIVAYFSSRDAVEKTAARVAEELSGCPAQGVPFTAETGSAVGALLSWGSDPPVEAGSPAWLERQSWRLWVTNRLGSALALAKCSQIEPASRSLIASRFALERLRVEGVDTDTWAPVSTAWQRRAERMMA